MTAPSFEARLASAKGALAELRRSIGSVIVGQDGVIEEVLWGLIAGGHVLLEGNPGLGKTLLVRTLAQCLDLRFSRIQFTPDLMPSDVTGTNVLVLGGDGTSTGRFELHKGPIFGQVVLADEINRATPKTQSALLEAMQEHAVTIAGTRHVLEEPFFVLATENPIEMEGTYPAPRGAARSLPAQGARSGPESGRAHRHPRANHGAAACRARARARAERRARARRPLPRRGGGRTRAALRGASSGRELPDGPGATPLVKRAVRFGAGVRGAQSLMLAAKSVALLEGRGHVSFGDVQRTAKPVLRHRILRSFEGEADGVSTDQVVEELVASVPTLPEAVEKAVQGR